MAWLGDLLVRLRAETADFQQDMGAAALSAERSMKQIERAAAALGTALSAGAFILAAKRSIDAAEHLHDLSLTTGIAADQLAGLGIAAKQSGGDVESISLSISKLAVNMGKTPEKFKALGVSAKDPLEAFKQLSDIFISIEDPELRAAVAAVALGKSWQGSARLLAEGSKRIGEMVKQGTELSGITKEIADQSDAFNDKLVLLVGTGGLMTRIVAPLLPLLNSLADDMLAAQQKTKGLSDEMSPLLEIMKVMIILASDVSFVFTTMGKDMARAAENVKLIATGQWEASRKLGEQFSADAKRARAELDAWQKKIMDLGKTKLPEGAPESKGPPPIDPAIAAARARQFAQDEAEYKRYVGALKTLEHQLGTLNHQTASEMLSTELYGRNIVTADGKVVHLEGSLEKLATGHKANLEVIGAEITRRQVLIQRIDAGLPMLHAEAEAIEQSSAALKEYILQGKLNADQMVFDITLLTASREEQEKAQAIRKIDLDLRQRQINLARIAGENMELFSAENTKLEEEAQRQREAAIRGIEERRRVERDWATGAQRAFKDYADAATNAGKNVETAITNGLQNAETALTDFINTGKLDLNNFIKQIQTDVVRGLVRQNIIGPIADWLGSLFGGSTGGGSGIKALDVSALKASTSTSELDLSMVFLNDTTIEYDTSLVEATLALDTFTASLDSGSTASLAGGGGGLGGGLAALFGGGGGAAGGEAIVGGGFEDLLMEAAVLAANGGIMSSKGLASFYSNGGIANKPQIAVFGEGRMNEAYVPLPDGKSIPVNFHGERDDSGGAVNVTQHITIVTPDPGSFRASTGQIANDMARAARVRR